MDKKTYKRYSIAFKQQVVREYEAGASAKRLREKYGIAGPGTINAWLKQYGREGSRYKLMVIQSPDEQNRVKRLEEQVRLLESALAQSQLNVLMLESVVAVADEHFETDLKKTFAPKSSPTPMLRRASR
jgi:transposase-like protein